MLISFIVGVLTGAGFTSLMLIREHAKERETLLRQVNFHREHSNNYQRDYYSVLTESLRAEQRVKELENKLKDKN